MRAEWMIFVSTVFTFSKEVLWRIYCGIVVPTEFFFPLLFVYVHINFTCMRLRITKTGLYKLLIICGDDCPNEVVGHYTQ